MENKSIPRISPEDRLLSEEDIKLDQCKFPKEEEEVLRPDELLQQYHAQRAALDAKIDQTLAEIQQLLGIEIK